MCVLDVLPASVGHFVCKIADTQLGVWLFSAELRTKPCACYFLSFFFNIPLYARVGNLQPFARIHKSWTVLVCNVVLGLNVEFRSMSSVDGDYKLTHTHACMNACTYSETLFQPFLKLSIFGIHKMQCTVAFNWELTFAVTSDLRPMVSLPLSTLSESGCWTNSWVEMNSWCQKGISQKFIVNRKYWCRKYLFETHRCVQCSCKTKHWP